MDACAKIYLCYQIISPHFFLRVIQTNSDIAMETRTSHKQTGQILYLCYPVHSLRKSCFGEWRRQADAKFNRGQLASPEHVVSRVQWYSER